MSMQIMVTKTSERGLDEENSDIDIEERTAEYGFTASLQNVGDVSIYDAVVIVSCNRPMDIRGHDADLICEPSDPKSASFRVTRPMHPNDRERCIAWSAQAKAHQRMAGVDATRIVAEFRICARDRQPESLVTEFDAHDRVGQVKEATPPEW